MNTAGKVVNTNSEDANQEIVPAPTTSNPEIFQKTIMADATLASLKQTEIENSFTEMKAILEALRKEVSQINAGTPDPNLTRCDHHHHRHASLDYIYSLALHCLFKLTIREFEKVNRNTSR